MIKTGKMARAEKIRQAVSLLLVSVLAVSMLLAMRPLPPAVIMPIQTKSVYSEPVNLVWPAEGQAALGAVGYGVLESHEAQESVPMASITKLVTAMTVLNSKPLKPGEQGPQIVMSEKDAALYPEYLERDGAVIPVSPGQHISQRKALEAMLIPSANNMADSLALWAFGSMDRYLTAANSYLARSGFKSVRVADASGFSPQSVGTAPELVRLGVMAMEHPVLAAIVGQSEATIPVAGNVVSTNWLLGRNNIIGIKTGNTDEAGGCYLFASRHLAEGREIIIVGAVLGAANLPQAMADSWNLLDSAENGFRKVRPVEKGQTVASYQAKWGKTAEVAAKEPAEVLAWPGSVKVMLELKNIAGPVAAGTEVGEIVVKSGDETVRVKAVMKNDLKEPAAAWRILR